MGRQRFTPEQIIAKLREVEVLVARGATAVTGTSTNDAFSLIGSGAFIGAAGQLRVQLFDTAGADYTLVQGDLNGDRVADFEVQLNGLVPLATTDLVL
jgi:serralysin